jgi:hypothetical protein
MAMTRTSPAACSPATVTATTKRSITMSITPAGMPVLRAKPSSKATRANSFSKRNATNAVPRAIEVRRIASLRCIAAVCPKRKLLSPP